MGIIKKHKLYTADQQKSHTQKKKRKVAMIIPECIKPHQNLIYKPGLEEESMDLPSRSRGSLTFMFFVSATAANLSNISVTVMR
jgi:hypothetical protein